MGAWIQANLGFLLTITVLIGGWLISFGAFRQRIGSMEEKQAEHAKKHEENEKRWSKHEQDETPHRSCLVELSTKDNLTASINDLKASMVRMENWIMALATKAGVKPPTANGG